MVKPLRESVIKDILDALDDVKDYGDNVIGPRSNTAINVSSISRASKDLIMSFPVLCDNSIDPKTAQMICKATERKAVTMLQMLFASCCFNTDNVRDVISQWHSNIDMDNMSLDDFIDLCDDIETRLGESALDYKQKAYIREQINLINKENKRNDKSYPVSSFSEYSVNDFPVTTRFGGIKVLSEAPVSTMRFRQNATQHNSPVFRMNVGPTSLYRPGFGRDDDGNITVTPTINTDLSRSIDSEFNSLSRQLLDTDVKKANELVPSLMIVRFYSGGVNGTVVNQAVVGVKARLIPIDSYDIIDRINSKNKDKAGFLNFIRATTKEISFVKDYLLAINRAKIDAKKNSIRNGATSGIWKTLEKRSTKSIWKRLIGRTNDASAITTLVISQQVVNILRKEYDVNLVNPKVASTIMDAYNLLSIVIVDESTEVARFLYDGDDFYEDISFNSLERESGDGSYKKVINLLSKMNRG